MYFDDGKRKQPRYDAMRTQIPLTPMRAITVYKAQGQTLKRVLIRIKTKDQARQQPYRHKFGLLYTAFSRVKSLKDMRITHFPKDLLSQMPQLHHRSSIKA